VLNNAPGSLFETVNRVLDVLASIDRKIFGITYKPENLRTCGNDAGPDGIRQLAHIYTTSIFKMFA
jgi:hypothetical protein